MRRKSYAAAIQSDVEETLNAWPRFRTSRESKEEPTFLTAGLQGGSRYCEGSKFSDVQR
jgi:hypothetical protein